MGCEGPSNLTGLLELPEGIGYLFNKEECLTYDDSTCPQLQNFVG